MTKPFTGFCEWVACDLEVLWVEFKQILHLKVGCSDFGPVWPCSGQGQFTHLLLGKLPTIDL